MTRHGIQTMRTSFIVFRSWGMLGTVLVIRTGAHHLVTVYRQKKGRPDWRRLVVEDILLHFIVNSIRWFWLHLVCYACFIPEIANSQDFSRRFGTFGLHERYITSMLLCYEAGNLHTESYMTQVIELTTRDWTIPKGLLHMHMEMRCVIC